MDSTVKWIIGLIIVVAIVWFGYSKMNTTDEVMVDDNQVAEEMILDGAPVDQATDSAAVPATEEVAQ